MISADIISADIISTDDRSSAHGDRAFAEFGGGEIKEWSTLFASRRLSMCGQTSDDLRQ
jgi:hypothetical protein